MSNYEYILSFEGVKMNNYVCPICSEWAKMNNPAIPLQSGTEKPKWQQWIKSAFIITVCAIMPGYARDIPPQSETRISETKAKSVALAAAKIKESEASQMTVKLRDMRRVYYEVGFKKGLSEYEYLIDAASGSVIKMKADHKKTAQKPSNETMRNIGENEAKSIALSATGIKETEADALEVRLKGWTTKYYKVRFKYAKTEYEYEIDALTGNMLEEAIDYRRALIGDAVR